MTGTDWVMSFLKINKNLLLESLKNHQLPELLRLISIMSIHFFKLPIELCDKFHITPDRIFNVDEMVDTIVKNKPSKDLRCKGKKQVVPLSSVERGTPTTAVICFSAAVQYILPLMMFSRVRHNTELV